MSGRCFWGHCSFQKGTGVCFQSLILLLLCYKDWNYWFQYFCVLTLQHTCLSSRWQALISWWNLALLNWLLRIAVNYDCSLDYLLFSNGEDLPPLQVGKRRMKTFLFRQHEYFYFKTRRAHPREKLVAHSPTLEIVYLQIYGPDHRLQHAIWHTQKLDQREHDRTRIFL